MILERRIHYGRSNETKEKGFAGWGDQRIEHFFKVIPGRAEVIREACKAADRDPRRLASFKNIGTLTEARWVLFDNDTRLAFSTVYEGDWDAYIEAFMPEVIQP